MLFLSKRYQGNGKKYTVPICQDHLTQENITFQIKKINGYWLHIPYIINSL